MIYIISNIDSNLNEETDVKYIKTNFIKAFHNNESFGKILYINKGKYKNGFKKCLHCSYCEISKYSSSEDIEKNEFGKPTIKSKNETKITKHKNPLTGKDCNCDNYEILNIGAELITDIRIFYIEKNMSEEQCYTFVELLKIVIIRLLECNITDINIFSNKNNNNNIRVVMYDNLSGGIGYSKIILEKYKIKEILKEMLKIANDCDCEKYCHKCLCNFYNQVIWDKLDRKSVINILEELSE